MDKINFQDGVKVSNAKVTIDEVDYPVTPARYNGATPLSSTIMNTMQDNIEDAIDQNANNIGGEDYDATSTYDVGDIVKYQGQLYICTTAIPTAEAWNSNHWQATDVLSSAGGNEIAIGSQSDITGKTKIFVEESTQRLKYKDSTTGNFTDIAGDEVFIGDEQDAPESTKLLVDTEDDSWNNIGTEVVDTLEGNEGNRAPSVRAVNELNTYSTEEVRIGTWIDGKPLYRKVINAGVINISAGSSINIAHNISNIELVNKVEAKIVYLSATTQNTYYLPYINGANNTSVTIVDKTNVVIKSIGEGWSGHNIYITLEYTKTTD